MIPSPTDLTYFIEVANLLNLSRAAECLGITQPSLTLAMQRLENTVGTPILFRHKRGVSLTKAGKQLLVHTRHLLDQWLIIKSATLSSESEVQGCFTLGCHSSVALFSLVHFLPNLLKTYPKLEIKLQHEHSRRIAEKVINLSIDIGIVVNPVKHLDLVIRKLADDKVTLWRHPTYPMTNFKAEQAMLLCDPDLIQTQTILSSLKKQKIQYGRLLTSDNLEVIAALTQQACGIGILPANVALPRQLVPLPHAPFYRDEICSLYRGENRNVKAIEVIIEAIKGTINTLSCPEATS